MVCELGLEGKTVAVFGLGRSGLSCLKALCEGGARVLAWDDTFEARQRAQSAGAVIHDFAQGGLEGCAALILSPGIAFTHPEPHWIVEKARALSIPIVGDTELFARAIEGSGAIFVAITGTNGKSTTTALLGHVLAHCGRSVSVGGNIGTPVFDLPPPTSGHVYVLELSSYQIDLMPTLRPDVGVLLNISEDHLDRHGTMERYAAIKGRILKGRVAVCGRDDPWCEGLWGGIGDGVDKTCFSITYPLEDGLVVREGVFEERRRGRILYTHDLKGISALPGLHNGQNIAAVYGVCRSLGLEPQEIMEGVGTFPGLAHRLERVASRGGVVFINDSKATNAQAAGRALACFDQIYWILGGLMKVGGIASLEPYFSRISHAYVIGKDGEILSKTLEGKVPYTLCETMGRAVDEAFLRAKASVGGGTILLSPACASFDQYRDFEERGRDFCAHVHRVLAHAEGGLGEGGREEC